MTLLYGKIAAIFVACLVWSSALADIFDSRPSDFAVRQATAECRLARTRPMRGIIGISDPHAAESAVAALVQETGARWVRAEFKWSEIQATPTSQYDWRTSDAMVAAYNKAGIKILGIITYIPKTMPPDWTEIDSYFQRFTIAVVRRYAPKGVHYWEIFNEPNLPGYGWLVKGVDPLDFLEAYTLLLARANKIVRKNDPAGIVVIGGLSAGNKVGASAEDTMRTLYRLGAARCFDVFAFHPYGYQNRFAEARRRVNAILAAGNDSSKPVWFNEYGWTDYQQMNMALNNSSDTNPMMAVFSQRKYADALFWFSAKDHSSRIGAPTFGLADFHFNKRDSFETFKYLLSRSN